MFDVVNSDELNLFIQPARIALVGNSGSGKTSLFKRLIEKYKDIFQDIIVIGGDLTAIPGVPHLKRDDDFNPLTEDLNGRTLILFDDCIYDKKILKIAAESFTKIRHKNCSVVLCSQNLFFNSNEYRTILHNLTHLFLLRIRCLKQLTNFARSFLSRDQIDNFIEIYKKTVLKEKYRYIVIDYTKDFDSVLMIRSNIFDENYEKAYAL